MGNGAINLAENAANEETQQGTPQEVKRKMHFFGKVIKTTLAGAIVDIGQDAPGMLHISRMKKEPGTRVEDVLKVGQEIDVWVRRVDPKTGRIELTMFEPLPLEWREIKKGMVVRGKVTRIEKFGVFVDIGAERPGLVHISEIAQGYIRTPNEAVKEGEEVEVKVIDVNRRKKRIRLSMKALDSEASPKSGREKSEAPEEPEKPVPTAMEIALREAMERTKSESTPKTEPREARKPSKADRELDEILNRTLESEKRA